MVTEINIKTKDGVLINLKIELTIIEKEIDFYDNEDVSLYTICTREPILLYYIEESVKFKERVRTPVSFERRKNGIATEHILVVNNKHYKISWRFKSKLKFKRIQLKCLYIWNTIGLVLFG